MGEGGSSEGGDAVGVGLYECLSDNIDANEEEELCAIIMSHVRIEVGGEGEEGARIVILL
jgi:hypothetical protein